MKRLHYILSFLLVLLYGNCIAFPGDTIRLDEVIVKTQRPAMQERSLAPMQQINAAGLARVAGISAAEALKQFSGVTIRDYGGIGGLKTIMVRSLGASHTGVFIDGMPLHDAATGQTDLGKIPLAGLEELSLFSGQPRTLLQPARYYASASIVQFKRQTPDFTQRNTQILTGVKTGSFGLFNPWMIGQWKFHPRSYADISFNYLDAHGEYHYKIVNSGNNNQEARRHNSDITALNLSLALHHQIGRESEMNFRTSWYKSERGLPGAVLLYNPFASQRLWNEDVSLSWQYTHQPGNSIQWLSSARFSHAYLRYLDPDYLNQQGKLDNAYKQNEFYFSQVVVRKWKPGLSFSVASDVFVQNLSTNIPGFVSPVRYNWLNNMAMETRLQRLEAHANILSTLVWDQQGTDLRTRNMLSPGFSLGYRLISAQPVVRARFMYKNIFRMPTFNDLYYTLVGNSKLKPEIADQFNLGFLINHQLHPRLQFNARVDGFYNQVKDKIVAVPTKNLFVWSMQNIGQTDIKGLEGHMSMQYSAVESTHASIQINYTRQHAIDMNRRHATGVNHQIPYIPRETFTGSAFVEHHNMSVGFNSQFTGYRYALGQNSYENLLPSWWHHDISVAWKQQNTHFHYRITFEINNLFDRQYEVIRSFPMPGRGFFVKLEAGI